MPVLARHTPVGERVDLGKLYRPVARTELHSPLLSRWTPFGSGTMALAAALSFAARGQPAGTPVALPAYSCPDIAAAALFARLPISYVDLLPEQTGIDPVRLDATLGAGARIAVLVDLFGTHGSLAEARELTDRHHAVLIHDRAQSLAGPGLETDRTAEFIIVSRGRGKPATLLGGGATWARNAEQFAAFATMEFPLATWSLPATMLRAGLYNLVTQPLLYGTVSQLPFLHIGETRLQPLAGISRLPQHWLIHASRQLKHQLALLRQRREQTLAVVDLIPATGFRIPADALKTAAIDGLNRLPVLCRDADQARQLVAQGAHLGISPMYGQTLPEFLGMSAAEAATAYPAAYRFSRTVVTVPTHTRINAGVRRKLRELFRNAN